MAVTESHQAQRLITAHKTAVIKLHNPSRRKRAMLDYALRHNHLAYTKVLKAIKPEMVRLVDEELRQRDIDKHLLAREQASRARARKWERQAILYRRINEILLPLPICNAAKSPRSIRGSIIGQIESYLELHGKQENVGLPTVQPIKDSAPDYLRALHALVSSRNV
jgi:hypothetical protein